MSDRGLVVLGPETYTTGAVNKVQRKIGELCQKKIEKTNREEHNRGVSISLGVIIQVFNGLNRSDPRFLDPCAVHTGGMHPRHVWVTWL